MGSFPSKPVKVTIWHSQLFSSFFTRGFQMSPGTVKLGIKTIGFAFPVTSTLTR
jgi:hypothetical protein